MVITMTMAMGRR